MRSGEIMRVFAFYLKSSPPTWNGNFYIFYILYTVSVEVAAWFARFKFELDVANRQVNPRMCVNKYFDK